MTFRPRSPSTGTKCAGCCGSTRTRRNSNWYSVALPANNREVAVITRSLMQQMAAMASQVEVPPEDVSQGRATPGWDATAGNTNAVRLIQIKCSKTEPADAFVTVELSPPLVLD